MISFSFQISFQCLAHHFLLFNVIFLNFIYIFACYAVLAVPGIDSNSLAKYMHQTSCYKIAQHNLPPEMIFFKFKMLDKYKHHYC